MQARMRHGALYTTAAVSLILNLTNRPGYVARQRREYRDWPY
jgi:hypothetical protein